jgi:uncharacterized cupredoxin-like copper-binding protein
MRKGLVAILLLPTVLAACGGGDESAEEENGGAVIETIRISETEFKLDPSTVHVDRAGTYVFEAVNDGTTEHALEIEGEGVEMETEPISPGQTARLEITLEEGDYEMYCPIDDHKGRGMEGEVAVGAGAGGGGTDTTETEHETGTTETEDDDSGY